MCLDWVESTLDSHSEAKSSLMPPKPPAAGDIGLGFEGNKSDEIKMRFPRRLHPLLDLKSLSQTIILTLHLHL